MEGGDYAPLKIFIRKSCPLCNYKTVKDILIKLITNIKHYNKWVCRDQEP